MTIFYLLVQTFKYRKKLFQRYRLISNEIFALVDLEIIEVFIFFLN